MIKALLILFPALKKLSCLDFVSWWYVLVIVSLNYTLKLLLTLKGLGHDEQIEIHLAWLLILGLYYCFKQYQKPKDHDDVDFENRY